MKKIFYFALLFIFFSPENTKPEELSIKPGVILSLFGSVCLQALTASNLYKDKDEKILCIPLSISCAVLLCSAMILSKRRTTISTSQSDYYQEIV